MESPLDKIRAAIEQATGPGRRTPTGWQLKCPAHSDREPSLSLSENNEHHALLYCQAGCATADVLSAAQLDLRDLYPLREGDRNPDPVVAVYKYVDEAGHLLYEVQRTATKKFRQRRPDPDNSTRWIYSLGDTRRVLYRLPHVLEAAREGQTVYVVEGEKDVHSWEARGCVATTNPGGVGKWRPEYGEALRGAHITIVADVDSHGKGLAHARAVAHALMPHAASLVLTQPAGGKDSTDHFSLGFGVDDLMIVAIDPPEAVLAAQGGQAEAVDAPVSGQPDPDHNPIRLTAASQFKIKPVRWLWEDRMPLGEITLVPGREGVGKSTFLAWMAAAITNGNLPGEFAGQPRAVLYAASEDAWGYTIAPRMLAAGANLDLVYRVDVIADEGPGRLTLPLHCKWLPEIAETHKAAILMCDPIVSLVHEVINTNRAQELRQALEPLRKAGEDGGFAIAALVHFNKTRDADLLSMVSGSRAWVEVARAVIAIAHDDEAGHNVVSQRKNNLGRMDLSNLTYTIQEVLLETEEDRPARVGRLHWGEDSDETAEEVLQRKPTSSTARSRSAGINAVLDFLDEQTVAVSPRQVADGCSEQVNYEAAKKILMRLANEGKIDRVGTGLYKAPTTGQSAGTAARARDTPQNASLSPPQTKGGGRDVFVPAGTREGTSRGGRKPVPEAVPQVSCRSCHGPFTPAEPGQLYHPLCHPDVSDVEWSNG